jgi:hypothetical protein
MNVKSPQDRHYLNGVDEIDRKATDRLFGPVRLPIRSGRRAVEPGRVGHVAADMILRMHGP